MRPRRAKADCKNDSVPRWFIGLIIAFALAIGTVGAIAVGNAATISERRGATATQFQDIKDRLIRIEAKLDALEK